MRQMISGSDMRQNGYVRRFARVAVAFIFICEGVVISKQAVSLSPWNVFKDGVSNVSGLTFGQASVLVAASILILVLLMKEKVGYGSLYDIFVSGFICDLLICINRVTGMVPRSTFLPMQVLLTLLAILSNSIGLYLYMSAGLGMGPIDTLFVGIAKRTHIPTGISKLILEAIFCFVGWLLGGEVGVCTIITVAVSGPMLQLIFKYFNFDPTRIQQESVLMTTNNIFGRKIL